MKKTFQFEYETLVEKDFTPEEKELFLFACESRKKAYAKYSNFTVGCAILLEDGNIITGNNQENAAFPSGTCAERAAIFWAKANYPDTNINSIFVVGGPENNSKSIITSPCGACRQSLLQYETEQGKDIRLYFAAIDGSTVKVNSIKQLLPFSFDGSELV